MTGALRLWLVVLAWLGIGLAVGAWTLVRGARERRSQSPSWRLFHD
jgi:hypothetical protein